MKIILPYPPSSNRYWRNDRGRMHRSEQALLYITTVGWHFSAAQVEPMTGFVKVTMLLFRPIRSGDLDNRIKIVLDAMQTYAYVNDNQVREIHAVMDDDKKNPRLEVEVTPYVRKGV